MPSCQSDANSSAPADEGTGARKKLNWRRLGWAVTATVIYYGSSSLDIYVALVVHGLRDIEEQSFNEFFRRFGYGFLTIILVGCPGVFFCLADKHTYYPIEDAGIDDKGRRKYQTMKYNYEAFRYPGQGMRALLNILHLRHLFEFILSLATGSFHKLSFKLYYGTMEIIQPRMKHSHSSVFSDRCFALLLYHIQHRVLKIAIEEMI
eukprot:jgi/Bigna1/82685/fgenesh1_pg.95_\